MYLYSFTTWSSGMIDVLYWTELFVENGYEPCCHKYYSALLNKVSKNICWIWQSIFLSINCSVFKCAFNRSKFFVLFCFFKGLDPDNLKRGSRIKIRSQQSHFRQFSHSFNIFFEKGEPTPLVTLPTGSTNDKLLKGCQYIMYFPFTMLSRPSFFFDYLLLFFFF